jgi:DNA-binding LacI/PurR family transcriptional regulator
MSSPAAVVAPGRVAVVTGAASGIGLGLCERFAAEGMRVAAGRRVPADVAVVSCDDMPFASYLIPSLTSLRVPFAETGELAVGLLLSLIAGQPAPGEPVLLPVELIVRDSSAAAAGPPP